jgi:hypothetical protein
MRRATRSTLTGLALATAVAILVASPTAWGHSFPAVRTVVIQVERCEVVLLVGYRPASGETTETLLARASTQPKSQGLDALRAMLTRQAMAPLTLSVDGTVLVPTTIRTKLGTEPGGARPLLVALVTYRVPAGKQLQLMSRDARTTRISWADRDSGRVDRSRAPAQGRWHAGVASFLLELASQGGTACVNSSTSPSSSGRQHSH